MDSEIDAIRKRMQTAIAEWRKEYLLAEYNQDCCEMSALQAKIDVTEEWLNELGI